MRRLLRLLACLLALLAACSSTQNVLVGPAGPPLEPYSAEEVRAEARWLLQEKGLDVRQRDVLLSRLDTFLASRTAAELMQAHGATGVVAYHSADGGFIVKGQSGEGLASFKGGGRGVTFRASGYTVGAVVGGGAHHGIGVVFGLVDQRRFVGDYSMSKIDALAGPAGISMGVARYEGEGDHQVRFFSTGIGLSADAGIGNFTVELAD